MSPRPNESARMPRLRRDPLHAALALAVPLFATAIAGCATTKTDAPLLVDWKVESSHPYVLAGEATEAVVNIDIDAKLPPEAQEAIPLNLSIVLDHSGSMSGAQMDDARNALTFMLSQLRDEDVVSVVAFSTQVEVLSPQTEWGDVDRAELDRKIAELTPRGTTAMQEALQTGYNEVMTSFDPSRINRIILLSDGIPNDASQLLAIAQNARSYGVAITTMGLGPYYNEDLMAQIADTSGGNYRFIRGSDELKTFFLAEKQAMEQVVARNLQLTFNLGPGVEIVQTLGGNAQLNGRQVSIYLGEIGPSDQRQIALKIRVAAAASGAKVEVVDAHLQWEDVVSWGGYLERWAYVEAESTKSQATVDQHMDKLVLEKVGRLHAAWEMENAIRDYQAGERERAKRRLQQAAADYRETKKAAEAALPSKVDSGDLDTPFDPPAPAVSGAGGQSLDLYLEEAAEALDDAEPESDEGKILIKSVKSRSRSEAR